MTTITPIGKPASENVDAIKMTASNHAQSGDSAPLYSISIPHTVGSWELAPGAMINIPVKKNWFHRMMTRLLLGWKWIDA